MSSRFYNRHYSIGDENPYYKTGHDLYSVPEAQFYDYLQREGTYVEDYWTGEDYRCFFRRNKDTNQTNDNISIYYPVENSIQPGSLISYADHTYLVLNQESLENHVYRRSDALNADVILSTFNRQTGEEISIPCFAYDLTGVTTRGGNGDVVMTAIAGNVELMTGDNDTSRKLRVNQEFYAMGNWYSITSVNYKTGIARIGAAIILDPSAPVEYALHINTEETYIQGSAVRMSANASINNDLVGNATLEWSSSNDDIVTITEDGNAMFVGVGTCAISCYWKEHRITETVYIEVIEEPVAVDLRCEISGKDTMNLSSSATFTAIFYQVDGVTEDTTVVPVWSLDVPSAITSNVTITNQSGKTITIRVSNGSSLVGKTFGLNLSDSEERYHATKTIRITSWL